MVLDSAPLNLHDQAAMALRVSELKSCGDAAAALRNGDPMQWLGIGDFRFLVLVDQPIAARKRARRGTRFAGEIELESRCIAGQYLASQRPVTVAGKAHPKSDRTAFGPNRLQDNLLERSISRPWIAVVTGYGPE